MSRIALLITALALMLMACGRDQAADPVPLAPAELPMRSVLSIEAGDSISILLGPIDVADGTPVQVIATGSFGTLRFADTFQDGEARLTLSAEPEHHAFTQTAGYVTLRAQAAHFQGEHSFTIRSGPPVEPITTLIGPKNITANNREASIASLIPFDQFGNPIADGTPFIIEALRPDGSNETYRVETDNLVAWRRLYSSTTSGRTRVASRFEPNEGAAAFGPEAILDETAGEPVAFSISADKTTAPADGRQLITLRSDPLRDRFDNELPDGTLVTFTATENDGRLRSLPAYTIDGVAELSLQAPTIPGDLLVSASVADMISPPLRLTFSTNDFELPLDFLLDNGTLTLTAGPVLGTLNQFLPDGLEAHFVILSDGQAALRQTGVLRDGYASARFRTSELNEGSHTLSVLVGDKSDSLTITISRDGVASDQAEHCNEIQALAVCLDRTWLRMLQ